MSVRSIGPKKRGTPCHVEDVREMLNGARRVLGAEGLVGHQRQRDFV